MSRVLAAIALLLVVAAGCTGGDSAEIDPAELKDVVLQPGDVGQPFVRFDEGRQGAADQPPGSRSDPARFGREEGWKSRYRRSGSPATKGPLVLESRADTFRDDDGARDELTAFRSSLGEGLRLTRDSPDLGDESFVATGTQGSGRFAVRFYLVGWRDENATASILANGFEKQLTLEHVVELARRQQQRIEEQLGG